MKPYVYTERDHAGFCTCGGKQISSTWHFNHWQNMDGAWKTIHSLFVGHQRKHQVQAGESCQRLPMCNWLHYYLTAAAAEGRHSWMWVYRLLQYFSTEVTVMDFFFLKIAGYSRAPILTVKMNNQSEQPTVNNYNVILYHVDFINFLFSAGVATEEDVRGIIPTRYYPFVTCEYSG